MTTNRGLRDNRAKDTQECKLQTRLVPSKVTTYLTFSVTTYVINSLLSSYSESFQIIIRWVVVCVNVSTVQILLLVTQALCNSQASGRRDSAAELAPLQCSSALWEISVLRELGNSPNQMAGSKQWSQPKSQMERNGEEEHKKHRCQREEKEESSDVSRKRVTMKPWMIDLIVYESV